MKRRNDIKEKERKKKLKRKRRGHKRKKMYSNTKIIADTNIGYLLGRDDKLFNKMKSLRIVPNYLNIMEVSKSGNLVQRENSVRNAIRRMIYFQDNTIFEPPFIHIAQLLYDYEWNVVKEIGDFLGLTSAIANGYQIDKQKGPFFSTC